MDQQSDNHDQIDQTIDELESRQKKSRFRLKWILLIAMLGFLAAVIYYLCTFNNAIDAKKEYVTKTEVVEKVIIKNSQLDTLTNIIASNLKLDGNFDGIQPRHDAIMGQIDHWDDQIAEYERNTAAIASLLLPGKTWSSAEARQAAVKDKVEELMSHTCASVGGGSNGGGIGRTGSCSTGMMCCPDSIYTELLNLRDVEDINENYWNRLKSARSHNNGMMEELSDRDSLIEELQKQVIALKAELNPPIQP